MKFNDKKALALTLQYIDDVVEEKLGKRLDNLESIVESNPLVLKEDASFTLVEGPIGPRGPRGFRGPEGEQGPAGRDARSEDVAKSLREDHLFVSLVKGPKGDPGKDSLPEDVALLLQSDQVFIESLKGETGPEGPAGPEGKASKPSDVARSLRRSKIFMEEVKGERGPQGDVGPMGPQGEPGIGIDFVSLLDTGELIYKKTDGTEKSAGTIHIPKAYDDKSLKEEIKKIKDELTRMRTDLTAQITRSMWQGGGSSGGGEVRIEFMDDFDRTTLGSTSIQSVVWNPNKNMFEVGSSAGDIAELALRVQNIEDYLGITIPPSPSTLGVVPVVSSVNQYLVGDGNIVSIPRGTPLDVVDLYSVRVVDPNSNNMVIDTAVFTPIETIDLYSSFSMYDYQLYLAYIQEAELNGPFPLTVPINTYINSTGTYAEIPFADFNINNIEAWRLTLNDEVIEPEFIITPTSIVVKTNRAVFGAKLELMINNTTSQGSLKIDVPLSGNRTVIDLPTYSINTVLNYATFDSNTNEIVSLVEYLTVTELAFESSFPMDDFFVRIWYS